MKQAIRRSAKFLSLLFSLCGVVLAQTQRPAALNVSFSLMASDRLRDVAYVQLKPEARMKLRPTREDFDIISVRVNSQGRSDLYRYNAPAPLRFVETTGRGSDLAVKRVVATFNALPKSERCLIFLIPDADPTQDYGSLVVADDAAAFPANHVRLVNLSGLPVQGALDGDTFSLGPEPRVPAPRRISGNFRLGVMQEKLNRQVPVFDQSLTVGDAERVMLVFLGPFRSGADLRTRVVRDSVREPLPDE
jgi:hypothetical protein